MGDHAIEARGLSKQYVIVDVQNPSGSQSIAESIQNRWNDLKKMLLRTSRTTLRSPKTKTYWAFREVSFQIAAGECVGIIGHNGAGKSTLLKLLSRITEPSAGELHMRGRVASLLEIGTGFHPELTGRENIFLNGAILGMTTAEIRRQYASIVDFAGVDEFLETPVKRFSSGMYVRLAFSVAVHLRADILIVDEVLAVGYQEFQKKCLEKMAEISANREMTIVFVSHNLEAIRSLCPRVICIETGQVSADGQSDAVISKYLSSSKPPPQLGKWISLRQSLRTGDGAAQFSALRVSSDPQEQDGPLRSFGSLTTELKIESSEEIAVDRIAVTVFSQFGAKLVNADSYARGQTFLIKPGKNRIKIQLTNLYLNPGTYHLGLWLATSIGQLEDVRILDRIESAFEFTLEKPNDAPEGITFDQEGLIPAPFEITVDES